MFDDLAALNERPAPFSVYTADTLWTDPHISARMLDFHLDPESDLASRRPAAIEAMVGWMDRRFGFGGAAVCDLGCGPGLYAAHMARRGARVTGVDFSARSIDYARDAARKAGLSMAFERADYLEAELPPEQDLVCLIYGDLCALSPEQRERLYAKVRRSLKPGGRFVFDVSSVAQFRQRQEQVSYGRRLMDGFWAPGDYFGFLSVFLYDDQNIALDRYLIVEPHRSREIFNWLQYFDPDSIATELTENGFSIEQVVDVLTGGPLGPSPDEFAVIARR